MSTGNALVGISGYSGTNTIKVRIVRVADPSADAVPPQYAQGPFNQYSFFFSPLQRGDTYQVLKYEVANNDHSDILQVFPESFSFTVNNYEARYKEPVEWRPNVNAMRDGTIYPANVSSFSNDDWKGWALSRFTDLSSDYAKDNYNYDPNTGTLGLTVQDDIFIENQYYKVEFQPQILIANNAAETSAGPFTEKVVVTDDDLVAGVYTLALADVGKLIKLKGTALFYTVQLPALSDMGELKLIYFEMQESNTPATATIKAAPGDNISWLFGNQNEEYLMPGERFNMYKEITDSETNPATSQWCIRDEVGGWRGLGEITQEDSDIIGMAINKLYLGGSDYDIRQFARFYNRYITRIQGSRTIPYANWNDLVNGIYPNRGKYSLAGTGLNANKAKTKTIEGQYIIGSDSSSPPGAFRPSQVGDFITKMFSQDETGSSVPLLAGDRTVTRVGASGNSGYDLKARPTNGNEANLGNTSRPYNKVNGSYVEVAEGAKTYTEAIAERFFVRL